MKNRRCSYKTTAEPAIVRNEQRITMQPIVAHRHDRAQARHYNIFKASSAEFQNIIETAAALYPTNESVNINAANSAIENGNLQNAARYLNRIKSSSRYYYKYSGCA